MYMLLRFICLQYHNFFHRKQTKFEFAQADGEDSEDKRRKFLERNRYLYEPCHEKINILNMRKQRRRSASQ